jgi:hypothetical protein
LSSVNFGVDTFNHSLTNPTESFLAKIIDDDFIKCSRVRNASVHGRLI